MTSHKKAKAPRKPRKAARLALPAPDAPIDSFDPETAGRRSARSLGDALHATPITSIVPLIGLFEASRTKWRLGEWEALASLQQNDIAADPDRGKLALLIAAGNAHQGDMARARQFGRLAAHWGCSRRLIAQVMISAVHNSLGRVAVGIDDEEAADSHFETALQLVEARTDATLLGRARRIRETAQMGLLPDATRLLGAELTGADPMPLDHAARLLSLKSEIESLRENSGRGSVGRKDADVPQSAPLAAQAMRADGVRVADDKVPDNSPADKAFDRLPDEIAGANDFSMRAFSIMSRLHRAGERHFLYLDTKSLPRSGLHYLKESLETIIGKSFSFCEWYQEPGCCRKMPCAVAGYATDVDKSAGLTLRMVKSHDFQLTNIAYPTNSVLRRLIMVRDPLFVLTSWWNLDLLASNGAALRSLGLNPVLLYFRHEPKVLAEAYHEISAAFVPPPLEMLQDWLHRRKAYILGFANKWADPDAQPRYQTVLDYDSLSDGVLTMMDGLQESLSADQKARLDSYRTSRSTGFVLRRDPFAAPTPKLAAFLETYADLFRQTALQIAAKDDTGTLVMKDTAWSLA